MRICGVVAEYNPFHSGHAYHLAEIRRTLGEDCAVVCCMSGDFVQRGEAAILPKHLRAHAAVLSGADLVLELPVPYSLSSAERFAENAVRLLSGLAVLTDLSFGAEDADEALLREIASVLLEHDTVAATLANLRSGVSYAAARERALYDRIRQRADILSRPNNILAVEYCKAMQKQGLSLSLLPVARKGAGHDQGPEDGDGPVSASYLRSLLQNGDFEEAARRMPEGSRSVLRNASAEGRALLDGERLECAVLSQLLRLEPGDLAVLPGAAEGLEHRLYAAIRTSRTPEEIALAAKTKRYPLARIRRMLCCAFLGISAADAAVPAPYIRVLAFNDKGREVLRLARKKAVLPLITKPAHAEALTPEARRIFELTARAADLYALALPAWKQHRPGDDWRRNAVYVR